MYKRITHNIIEEHFENYNEGSTKSFLGKSKVPTNEIFNKNTFNDNVSAYATNYAQDIISMINSLTGTEDDLIVPFEKLYTIVDNLGNLTKPFYSSELGERINIVLRSIPLLVFMSVNSMKLGRDPQLLLDRLDSNSIVLSNALSNFNLLWNNLEIQNILKSFASGIKTKLNAVKDKNSMASQQADDLIKNSFKQFTDVFSNGILDKFPNRFFS